VGEKAVSVNGDAPVPGFAELEALTPWNFDEVVGDEKHVLAMFYAPWCGGCKKYMPKFVETSLMLKSVPTLRIVKADVTEFEYEELKENLNVSKVPAIKIFKKGSTEPRHVIPQDPWEMHFAIKEAIGLAVPNKCMFGDSDAEDVTAATWDAKVMDPSHTVLVEFFAPWCKFCKKFTPTYNNIARKAMAVPGLRAVRVNIDAEKSLGQRYGVKKLPSLMVFSKQNKKGKVYELPEADQHLEMVGKILAYLQEPESTPDLEEQAQALLTRVQKHGDLYANLDELARFNDLNITQVWKSSIVPLQGKWLEEAATTLKDQAVELAGAGKYQAAIGLLDQITTTYPTTKLAQSESVENVRHNCEQKLSAAV